jgi:hypothetical protein
MNNVDMSGIHCLSYHVGTKGEKLSMKLRASVDWIPNLLTP